jgi:RimJ/RimL family protein N-acetyltransferase
VRLSTRRFGLRAPEERDLARIVEGCSDPGVARYIPVIPVPYTERDARAWRAAVGERDERSFAITPRPDGELLGVVTVRLHDGGAVGYWLHPDARGQGAMAEALGAVVAWAEEQGVHGLMLTAHPENRASQRVAEQAGFVRTGTVAHDPPFRDGSSEAIRYDRPSAP